jgi:hypothetical protein
MARGQGLYDGVHGELAARGVLGHFTEEYSMDMWNDPRFFQSSVLGKRLSAFGTLSIISGFMVGTANDACMGMKKDINLMKFPNGTPEGIFQATSLFVMTLVLFANVVGTYVGVAQLYHCYRLETSGPTGFEIATSYYLNPNIVAWRHIAVKLMMLSFPMFLFSGGLRVDIRFDRAAEAYWKPIDMGGITTTQSPAELEAAEHREDYLFVLGWLFGVMYVLLGLIVSWVHWKHSAVFKESYNLAKGKETPYLQHVYANMNGSTMRSERGQFRNLDV